MKEKKMKNWMSALARARSHARKQQPHQRRATTTTAFCTTTHKCTTLSSLLPQKNSWNWKFNFTKKNSWNSISRIVLPLLPPIRSPPPTLLGARFVIKVSFIIIINIFMLIHHYHKNLLIRYLLIIRLAICLLLKKKSVKKITTNHRLPLEMYYNYCKEKKN